MRIGKLKHGANKQVPLLLFLTMNDSNAGLLLWRRCIVTFLILNLRKSALHPQTLYICNRGASAIYYPCQQQ